MVIQWLCFTPPSTINDATRVGSKLLNRELMHSNVLFREFGLISMWRVPTMPIGTHTLLSLLAEPLKHPSETSISTEDRETSDSLREFHDWLCNLFSKTLENHLRFPSSPSPFWFKASSMRVSPSSPSLRIASQTSSSKITDDSRFSTNTNQLLINNEF
ncbi:nuclear pore complex protein NUP107 [Helianthus annuus]|uniref:nuclear pore complex protein NUP107 n=1 Tax=Helianthus annuus TaxID=4232 RepID=UPI000B90810E|nr:nuclear pore complex protein NUP107 [Helianthus annuus]